MKIVTDFYLDVPRNFWEDKLAEDPLEFPTVRAVEKLASQHECHFFCSSQEEYGDKTISGLNYHVRHHWKEWLPEIKLINPDVIVTNGYFDVSVGVAGAVPDAKKIFVLHCEPAAIMRQAGFGSGWKKFDTVVTALDIGVEQLNFALPDLNVVRIPFGVNVELCKSYAKPMPSKQNIACGSNWYPNKGGKLVDDVLLAIAAKFNRPTGQNWGGLPKRQYIQKLSESKLIFFPSYSEGTSRSLSEAAACGVMPVVALESASNVEHVKKMGGIAIRTGMYSCPSSDHPNAVQFTRPPEEIAEELINIADNTVEFTPNLTEFNARHTINKYIDLIQS